MPSSPPRSTCAVSSSVIQVRSNAGGAARSGMLRSSKAVIQGMPRSSEAPLIITSLLPARSFGNAVCGRL